MNDGGSISDFFYNVIPGILFLAVSKYLYQVDVVEILGFKSTDIAIVIFIYIVIGLFLGFLFQGFTKELRNCRWNNRVYKRIQGENKSEFDSICKHIFSTNYKQNKGINVNKTFYLMDSFLRGEKQAFLPTHFSSRFAFWANISWGIFFILIFGVFKHPYLDLFYLLPFLLFFSLRMADEHLTNFYASILNSYYMLEVLKIKRL